MTNPHPPQEESIKSCLDLGLITQDEFGIYHASQVKKHRVQWGEIELIKLVQAVWPDIPDSGVPFQEVIDKVLQHRISYERSS